VCYRLELNVAQLQRHNIEPAATTNRVIAPPSLNAAHVKRPIVLPRSGPRRRSLASLIRCCEFRKSGDSNLQVDSVRMLK